MAVNVSIPKGTRDFSPEQMNRRKYIFNTIELVFRRYGYLPIETPAMENLSTLTGKYGEEGDRLIFKILNSGNYLSDFDETQTKSIEKIIALKKVLYESINNKESKILDFKDFNLIYEIVIEILKLDNSIISDNDNGIILSENIKKEDIINKTKKITNDLFEEFINDSNKRAAFEKKINNLLFKEIAENVGIEKGLRYDLTVPFARYVVQHKNEITLPFKRYQIQPVWRADRPQKGRYREFCQCDADVIGSNSLLNEVELIQIVDEIFRKFGLNIVIKINNRKILSGIAEIIGEPEKFIDITVAIDKFEKIGKNGVIEELKAKGLSMDATNRLIGFIDNTFNDQNKLDNFKSILQFSDIGKLGIAEMVAVFEYLTIFNLNAKIEFDPTLARGLNYYTGTIIEVKAQNVSMGSICGGGRYDDLTGIFGMPGVSGVGISFGADRIYDVLNELKLFPENTGISTTVLFVNFGEEELKYCLKPASNLRNSGIKCEIYPDAVKMKKQFEYADKKNIPYVAIAGAEEIAAHCFKLKNMASGEEKKISLNEMISELKNEYI